MKTLPLLSSAIFQQENEMTYSTALLKIKTLIKKCYILVQKIYNKQNILPGGESNPVSRVTGGVTHHYTTEEFVNCVLGLKEGHDKESALTDGWNWRL